MKNTHLLRNSLVLGATVVLLALGCGEGGPGTPGSIESPFSSPPPSDERSTPPSSGPFQSSAPSSGGGYVPPSSDGGGFETPPPSGGGFTPPPGGGASIASCVTALTGVYNRCNLGNNGEGGSATISPEAEIALTCALLSSAPSCAACVLPRLSTISCEEFDGDDAPGPCESACEGLGNGGSGGSSGSGGAGGEAGSGGTAGTAGSAGGGNGDLCSRCGDLAQCPGLPLDVSTCLQACSSAPPGCAACVQVAGTDCDAIGQCLTTACGGE
jgi:hypothetical protein